MGGCLRICGCLCPCECKNNNVATSGVSVPRTGVAERSCASYHSLLIANPNPNPNPTTM